MAVSLIRLERSASTDLRIDTLHRMVYGRQRALSGGALAYVCSTSPS